nr:MAG TPA: hypothetical protein [Bacteriophage sp.]
MSMLTTLLLSRLLLRYRPHLRINVAEAVLLKVV